MRRVWFLCARVLLLGCRNDAPPPPAPVVHAPSVAPSSAPSVAPSAAPSDARPRDYVGRWDGRAVDPPLREFDHSMEVVPWQGEGELRLHIPAGDGPVDGTMLSDHFQLTVRGSRYGNRVRATLDADYDAGNDAYRGMLDAELQGDALSGTWRASAEAGRKARSGAVHARPE